MSATGTPWDGTHYIDDDGRERMERRRRDRTNDDPRIDHLFSGLDTVIANADGYTKGYVKAMRIEFGQLIASLVRGADMSTQDTERTDFEAHYRHVDLRLDPDSEDGAYLDDFIDARWLGWQARASKSAQLPAEPAALPLALSDGQILAIRKRHPAAIVLDCEALNFASDLLSATAHTEPIAFRALGGEWNEPQDMEYRYGPWVDGLDPRRFQPLYAGAAPSPLEVPAEPVLHLNVAELKDALAFTEGDPADNAETDICLSRRTKAAKGIDGEDMQPGLYVWFADYPEEGCIGPLASPTPPVPATLGAGT